MKDFCDSLKSRGKMNFSTEFSNLNSSANYDENAAMVGNKACNKYLHSLILHFFAHKRISFSVMCI